MLLFLLAIARLFFVDAPKNSTLTVDVQNVTRAEGTVSVAVYRPCDGFPVNCKPLDGQSKPAQSGTMRFTFSVAPGTYAVALYHDVNGNGKMDKRLFGIPKEPYGFSNNFRPKLTAPKFSDCQFEVKSDGKRVEIRVE